MKFHEAANFLFDLRRFALRPGTEATRSLLAQLGDPHDSLDCVQIAGSNGKGSTARMVERTLREAGLDVGLYTSPHLDDVRERIRVNGRKITESAVVEFVESVEPYVTDRAADGTSPTLFETLTALAYWEFERQSVDVAVVEVGIGGKLDATSVVDPVASAVTTVTLEHTDILGDTVAEIARDKAHVAPADRPLVTATEGDALDAVRDVAGDVVTVADTSGDVTVTDNGREGLEGSVSIAGDDWRVETNLPLLGAHQAINAGIAATLCRQVAAVDEATIERGLRNAHWPGRFEIMGRDPLVVLDGAHNPGGVERVVETLATFDYDDLHVVAGSMVDKDLRAIAGALDGADHVVACEPDRDRAEDEQVVAKAFRDETAASVETRSDVAGAFDVALDAAGEDDCVLVTGSLYAVAEARQRWIRPTIPKQVDGVAAARETIDAAHVTDAGAWRMRGKAVHRLLKTRVQPRQAQYLKEELLSLGGDCAISGLNDQDEEMLDVLLMGTMAQFRRLTDKLDGQPYGLASLADELRTALDIQQPDRDRGYPWEDGTAVMGICNITPDSFHDGGEYDAVEDAVARAESMVAAGVDVLDVGGESTRPGADEVPVEEEIERIVPVIERLADLDAAVAVDTRKAPVARAALDAGADILNDVSGLEDPEMRLVAADYDVPVVVMHSIEVPVDPDSAVDYDDVVEDCIDQLTERVLLAEKAGLDREQIVVDPGLGFGKTAAESFELLGRLEEFQSLGCPILVGHSHKSMFELVGAEAGDCLDATIAGTTLAAERGADIVRVHDVPEAVRAVNVVEAADDPESFVEEN
ncbi:dihydropteroate synthase [Halomicrobium mukohataei]|uniref:Probable bifunctional folylpolyglutamate synthase/dihydropteroate synthase n=3 Tax=Haloarculaceae TaxID=1963268 RepID=A0A847UJZ1_9EURY|nr:dihydropteroate synthase [Halomicrobium mukohataei]NLV11448.1 dihydropteroate synthase [Halomicrobium mukohataei]